MCPRNTGSSGAVANAGSLFRGCASAAKVVRATKAPAAANWVELGRVKQQGGQSVHAWAFEGDCPADFLAAPNTFDLEWPPRSGRVQQFPEIDRAEFFPVEKAKRKINEAQIAFLDR